LTDDERGSIPQILRNWGRSERELGERIPKVTLEALGLASADAARQHTDAVSEPLRAYVAAAWAKESLAEQEYLTWIGELNQRITTAASPDPEHERQLAEAYHRIASLYSDMCWDCRNSSTAKVKGRSDSAEKGRELAGMIDKYCTLELSLRRSMVLRAQHAKDVPLAEEYLERLAYAHGGYGWNLQLCRGSEAYARTLWQYSVAAKLYNVLPPDRHSRRREDVHDRLGALESDGSSASHRLIRKEVRTVLDSWEIGENKDEHGWLMLDYPIDFVSAQQ
jgi:hypothetical protein